MKPIKLATVPILTILVLTTGAPSVSAMAHVSHHTVHTSRSASRVTRTTSTHQKSNKGSNKSMNKNTTKTNKHAFKSDSIQPGSKAWKESGYGVNKPFPGYGSNNMGFFKTWFLWSMFSNNNSTGSMTVKDCDGKDHSVTMKKSKYNEWYNKGNELVWRDGHVYVIKNNTKIV